LPYAFRQSGLYGGIIGIIVIAFVTEHCCKLLVTVKNSLPHADEKIKTYGDVGTAIWGKRGRILVDCLLIFTQTGFCIGYTIFMAENVESFLPDHLNSWLRRFIAVLIPAVAVLPFVFVKKVAHLGPTSFIADILLLFGMAMIYRHDDCGKVDETNGIEILTYPIFLGILTASYEGIGLVIPVQQTMVAQVWRYPLLLDIVLVIVTALLGSFGVLGYLTYAGDTDAVITNNLPSGAVTDSVKIALTVAILFTYPMQMFPVTEILDKAIFRDKITLDYFDMRENGIRLLAVVFTATVAFLVPFFGLIGGLVGAFGSSILAFVLPVTFHMMVYWKELPKWIIVKDCIILVFGVASCILGTTLALKAIVEALI